MSLLLCPLSVARLSLLHISLRSFPLLSSQRSFTYIGVTCCSPSTWLSHWATLWKFKGSQIWPKPSEWNQLQSSSTLQNSSWSFSFGLFSLVPFVLAQQCVSEDLKNIFHQPTAILFRWSFILSKMIYRWQSSSNIWSVIPSEAMSTQAHLPYPRSDPAYSRDSGTIY